ncbi:unnamed protein product [Lampetra fluviatilis]
MPFTLMKQKGEARVKSAEHLRIGCRTRARPFSFPGGVDNGHRCGDAAFGPPRGELEPGLLAFTRFGNEQRGHLQGMTQSPAPSPFLCYPYFWCDVLQEVNLTQQYLQTEGLTLDKVVTKLEMLLFLMGGHVERESAHVGHVRHAPGPAVSPDRPQEFPVECGRALIPLSRAL